MSDETPDVDIIDLDLSHETITEVLKEAPLYLKKAVVKARPAVPGEQIKTILADGREETVNTAEEGDIVITNPGGEEYVMKFEKFTTRYDAIDEDGNYRAKGAIRAITNPAQKNIRVIAPWGEEQYGDAECLIATPYDPLHPELISSDRYIIAQQEFIDTYVPIEPAADNPSSLMTTDQVAEELARELPPTDI